MTGIFTADEAWSGGFFELLLFLGPHDDSRIRQTMERLWSHPSLEGCWIDRNREPSEQERVSPGEWNAETLNLLRGIATLPNGEKCACASSAVTDDDGDWVYFGTPLGSLGSRYEIGAYPFGDGTNLSWLVPISEWLAEVAKHTFARLRFPAGVIGFLTTIEVDETLRIIAEEIPAERWIGYLREEAGRLAWYPPNVQSAPMQIGTDGQANQKST